MLTTKKKAKLLLDHRIHDNDTGSPESQIALLTAEISSLARHLKKHPKDNSSRIGLLKMVAKRKRQSDYLKRSDPNRYERVATKLNLKK